MQQFIFFLKILIVFCFFLLLVGCTQETETVDEAAIIESTPTETQLPPTLTEIPPTATQVPPTQTKVPSTKTPTTESTKVLTEVAFTKADLLGLWTSEKQPNMSMSFEENGVSKFFADGVLAKYAARYELQEDMLSTTMDNCDRIVDGVLELFTCTGEYRLTYYTDEDNQAYLSFELIGEDLNNFRRGMLSSGAFWVRTD